MKIINNSKYILLTFLSLSLILYCGCSSDDGGTDTDPTPDDPQAAALQKMTGGGWSLTSVTRNGADVTSDFIGFTMNFTSSGFSTTNGASAWESSGSWSWNDAQATAITLDNGIVIQISFSNNDTQLNLAFTLTETTFDIGRVKSLAGDYVFVLSK